MKQLTVALAIVFAVFLMFVSGSWSSAQDGLETGLPKVDRDADLVRQGNVEEEDYEDEDADEEDYEEEDFDDAEFDEDFEEEGFEDDRGEEFEDDEFDFAELTEELENASLLADLTMSERQTAAFVLSTTLGYLDELEAVALLEESLSNARDPATKRLIRMKLAELYAETDQPEEAKRQLRILIVGE